MKRYLNRAEKTQAVVLGAISETLGEWAKKDRELGRKARAKAMQMASTWAFKALQEMLAPLDDDQAQLIIREANRSKVQVFTPSEAALEARPAKKQEVLVEDVYGLARLVIETACVGCRFDRKAVAECEARRVLLKLDVPMFDEQAAPGECPYRIPMRR